MERNTRQLQPPNGRKDWAGDPPPNKKIRVLLADELTLVREGLRLLIDSQPDMEVVAEASDAARALERLKAVHPDVAVLDVSVPPLTSVRIARCLLGHYPGIKLVVLAGRAEAGGFPKQVRAKISGYVGKESSAEKFLRAIRRAASDGARFDSGGTTAVHRHVADLLRNGRNTGCSLTTREETVLRLVAIGHTNKEIAAKLSLSPKTVEAHKFRIGKKLGKGSRVHMVRYALRRGWLAEDAVVTPPD